ncbi:MAG: indole-3-glycerol-phosphate synthase TrpC, partial [Flavobacterium sp.]
MNLLDTLVQSKKQEITYLKTHFSNRFFEEQPLFNSATRSLKKSIENSVTGGIIAEFKRQSPSKGVLHAHANVEAITTGYTA